MSNSVSGASDQVEAAIQAFNSKPKGDFEVEKYERLSSKDALASIDDSYRHDFNGFYKLRRSESYQDIYYDLLNRLSSEPKADLDLKEILQTLFDYSGSVEISFASKMLSILDPDKPIWDSNIFAVLKARDKDNIKKAESQAAFQAALARYALLEGFYEELFRSGEADRYIEAFDERFPHAEISDTKKVDYVLWAYGETLK